MTKNTGRPNRVLAGEYLSLAESHFEDCEIYVTSLFGDSPLEFNQYFKIDDLHTKDLKETNRHIRQKFNAHADGDFSPGAISRIVSGIFIVVRKK